MPKIKSPVESKQSFTDGDRRWKWLLYASWLLSLYPGSARAHDGDMSLYLFGPMSLVLSIGAMRIVRAHWFIKLLAMLCVWPLLMAAVYGTVHAGLTPNYDAPVQGRDDSFRTLALFYMVLIPIAMAICVVLVRRVQQWLSSDA